MMYLMVYDYVRVLFLFIFIYSCIAYVLNRSGVSKYTVDAVYFAAIFTLAIRCFVGTYAN